MGKNSILTVTDASGCKVSVKQARVSSPTRMPSHVVMFLFTNTILALKQTVQVTNAKCFKSADGVVSVSMEGGEKPYSYQWLGSSVTDSTLTEIGESIVYHSFLLEISITT